MAVPRAKTVLTDDVAALCRKYAGEGAIVCKLLSSRPVSCEDVRALAQGAHAVGKRLVVDASEASLAGTAAAQLGADVVVASDAVTAETHRVASDVAQAFAAYLSCHPAVAEIRYPGLKSDPSFTVAAQVLVGGFGPLISWRPSSDAEWRLIDVRGYTVQELIRSFEATTAR